MVDAGREDYPHGFSKSIGLDLLKTERFRNDLQRSVAERRYIAGRSALPCTQMVKYRRSVFESE